MGGYPPQGIPSTIGNYSVIAQKQSTLVWGENEYGEIIARGEADVDDASVIQTAINSLTSGGTVFLKRGTYNLTTKLDVWGGVRLDMEQNAVLKNSLSDIYAPVLEFKQYSGCGRLNLDANGQSGILFGEDGKVNLIKADYLNIYSVGTSYVDENNFHFGVKFFGYGFFVDSINITGGNTSLILTSCSDDFINKVLVVDYVTGIKFVACEHCFVDSLDLDSGSYIGMQIDTSHDIHVKGTCWANNTAYPGISLTYGALIGEYSSTNKNRALDIRMRMQRHGGTAMKVSNTEDSIFEVDITNAELYTTSPAISTGIVYGSGLAGNLIIKGNMSGIGTPISGTIYGILDMPNTRKSGTATITASQTSVDVAHGLASTPTRVLLTPTTDTGGKRYWVSAKGPTTFTITIDSVHTADITFDWRALIGEG